MIQEDPQFCENSKSWHWARKWECIISNRNKQKTGPVWEPYWEPCVEAETSGSRLAVPVTLIKDCICFQPSFPMLHSIQSQGSFLGGCFSPYTLGLIMSTPWFPRMPLLRFLSCALELYLAPPGYPRDFNCHKRKMHSSTTASLLLNGSCFLILPFSFHFLRFQGPSVLSLTFWTCWTHLSYLCSLSLYTGIQLETDQSRAARKLCRLGLSALNWSKWSLAVSSCDSHKAFCGLEIATVQGTLLRTMRGKHWFSVLLQIPSVTRYTLALCPFP